MHKLLDKINGLFERKQDFCLAYLTAKRGTAPRDPGAAMIIAEGLAAGGSIGGGALEHLVCQAASRALQGGPPMMLSFRVRSGQAEPVESDGDVDVLVDPVMAADAEAKAVFEAAAGTLNQGGRCHLLTLTSGPGRLLLGPKGVMAGIPPQGFDPALWQPPAKPEVVSLDRDMAFSLPLSPAPAVFILGSGHVAAALAPLMATLDFRVVVGDDLPQAANSPAAKAADAFLLRPFDQPFGSEGPGINDYVVCMARTHQLDRQSLAQVLGRGAAYVGMIGSSRKKQEVYEGLAQDGFDDHTLGKVHCPIGLSIGARTPQEIAVSIAAEIIAARAQAESRKL